MGDLEQHCQKSVRVECGLSVLTSYEVRSLFPTVVKPRNIYIASKTLLFVSHGCSIVELAPLVVFSNIWIG